MFANLTIPADAPTRGMWSSTQPWPLNGLHSVLLPNGRVLTYGTPAGNAATQDGRTYDVWDPALGFGTNSHVTSYLAQRANSFCSSATFLDDGRLLVSGGNSPLDSTVFTPSSGATATSGFRMADDRWYGTLITLPDGRALMTGGSAPYAALRGFQDPVGAINAGSISMTPEIYSSATGWRSLFGAYSRDAFGPDHNRYWYPRMWVVGQQVFGISSEKMWYLNPAGDGTIRTAGNFKTGVDNTTRPNIGPTSSAVLYAPGRVLQVGGNGYHDGHATPASALATIIDVNGANPVLIETAAMSFPRHWPSATVLLDGRVVVTGGTRFANNGGADAVYEAELWNPASGTWTVGARAAQIRVYHSAAILMPNGTVLSTGGGAPGPVNNLNAEVYYPPYLFRTASGRAELAPRLQLKTINALKFVYGGTVEFDLTTASPVSRVVLIGTSSVTHSFNTHQRYQALAFAQNGVRVAAELPQSGGQAPPGYYLVAVLDAAGVPSNAAIIALGPNIAPPPVPTLLPRGNTITLMSTNVADAAIATDTAGLAVLKSLGPNPSAADLLSAQFIVRDGFNDSRCVSLESAQTPGRWLRHYGYRLQLGTDDGSALFDADATFCPEAGLSGTGITLRSTNFAANVIRHRTNQIWLDPVATGGTFSADASFTLRAQGLPAVPSVAAPPILPGAVASYAPAVSGTGLQYSWDFGDGTPSTAFSSSPNTSHAYTTPGIYLVTLTLRAADGRTATKTFVQAVYSAPISGAPRSSGPMALETRGSASARIWLVNPDNNTVSVFDTATNARVSEVTVGSAPRTLAIAPDGRVWVVNRDANSISVVSPSTLTVVQTIALPRASQPYGVVFAPDASAAFVALEATGQVLRLNVSTGAQLGITTLGGNLRHLAVNATSTRLFASRFVTPPLPGESTGVVQTSQGGAMRGGEVVVLTPATLATVKTIVLRHSERTDSSIEGRGIPNYLGAAVIAPDGRSAWVPSKQDNVLRGTLRSGANLDFQNTVRAISSRIDLGTELEVYEARVDHDDSGVASSAAFHATGAYLFVALETSRQIAVMNAIGNREFFRIEVGRAPQGVVLNAAGTRLYAHNFMDRSLSVIDLEPLVRYGEFRAPLIATIAATGSERLSAQVLTGKRLFYDARDTRLARDAYMSCASCHNDGGQDGRVWDLTGLGEGVRNTIGLRGRAADLGRLH
ncbi:MAG TPA: AbfB domain-containing protein, partial [Polyangiaceae bacterium]